MRSLKLHVITFENELREKIRSEKVHMNAYAVHVENYRHEIYV